MLMEETFASLLETSLIGGGFVFLLYHYVTRVTSTMERIADTLKGIDARMYTLERRMNRLDGGDRRKELYDDGEEKFRYKSTGGDARG